MEQRQYGKIETGCNGQYRQDGLESDRIEKTEQDNKEKAGTKWCGLNKIFYAWDGDGTTLDTYIGDERTGLRQENKCIPVFLRDCKVSQCDTV